MIYNRQPLFPVLSFAAPTVHGLSWEAQQALSECVAQWAQHYSRNVERMLYLDMKNRLKDLAVSIPPELLGDLDVTSGWPAKAVYELANRIVFERVASHDSKDRDPFGLMSLLDENRFAVEFPQAVASSLAQSVAFGTVTKGDAAQGEPEVLFTFHSALWATGIWNRRTRALKYGLIINDIDRLGHPTMMTLLMPGETVVIAKGAAWYVSDVYPSPMAHRIPMEPLPFRPTLERPFGRSRIDRTVMSLTDRAMRASARLEVHSELFSAIKLILMGAGADAFQDAAGQPIPLWSFYMGRLNTLSKDEDGDLPKLEQISSQSPEPHIAVKRQLATEFSGHTGVPLGSLGIATDNPESGDAKKEAREDIYGDAEAQGTVYGFALRRLFEGAVMLRDGLSEPPQGMRDLQTQWRDASRPTRVALAAAGAQQVAAVPGLANTEVGLELIGLDAGQIERYLAEVHQGATVPAQPETDGVTPPVTPDAGEMKAQFDALGVAIRAGVDPDDAARRVGLPGITFTGATPVSLRQPEAAAEAFEER